MTPEDRDTLTQMRAIQDRTERTLAEIRGMRGASSTQQVTQTAGHPGSSLVLACAVLVGMNIGLCAIVGLMGVKLFGLDDKLTAIYMIAPQLQPEPEK